MSIPRYLNKVVDLCTPTLVLAFLLDFVKPRQVLFVARSRHEPEDLVLRLHESDIKYDGFVEGRRSSGFVSKEKSCNSLR